MEKKELPKSYFIPMLLELLSSVSKYLEHCEQYFDGLSVLIKNEPLTHQSKNVLYQVIQLLKDHPTMEVCEFSPIFSPIFSIILSRRK